MARNDDDELDFDEEGLEDDDEEDDLPSAAMVVERMTSIEAWEMFRIVQRDGGARIATVGLRPPGASTGEGSREIGYALWFPEDVDEPGRSGAVAAGGSAGGAGEDAGAWNDRAREVALREVLAKERRALEREPDQATFRIGSREARGEGDGGDPGPSGPQEDG